MSCSEGSRGGGVEENFVENDEELFIKFIKTKLNEKFVVKGF